MEWVEIEEEEEEGIIYKDTLLEESFGLSCDSESLICESWFCCCCRNCNCDDGNDDDDCDEDRVSPKT